MEKKPKNIVLFDDKPAKVPTRRSGMTKDRKFAIAGFSMGGVAIVCLVAAIIMFGKGAKNDKNSDITLPTASPTISAGLTSTPMPTATPAPSETPEATPSSSNNDGVFSEISKSEIIERAQYIYANDITEGVKQYTSVEEIADLIAITLGQLPIYGTGSLENAICDSMQESIQVFGNWDGTSGIYLPKVHYALQAPDGSDLSKFMAKYDEVFNNIADGRNSNDPEKVIENIQKLAVMQYYDYVFTDSYSNSTNFINEEYQAGILRAVLERYPNYVSEYIHSNNLTICVPVCLNQETHEEQMVNVLDIYQAIMNGISDDKEISLSSSEGGNPGGKSEEYYEALLNELEYKDDHGLVLK